MGARGPSSGRLIWRSAVAFVAAYLLVIQAALAGVGMPPMQSLDNQAMRVICLNGESGAPAGDESRPAPFDCCGLGCLVGSQTLQSPSSPDEALTYPASRTYDPGHKAQGAPLRATAADGPRPRGPPAVL